MTHKYSRAEKVAFSSTWVREEPIKLSEVDTLAFIEANKFTLIGRVTNPDLTKPKVVIAFLPTLWSISGRVSGKNLGRDKFQFTFSSEHDIEMVLKKAPFHYKHWMIILQRWELVISDKFLSLILFWIRVQGLPLNYWIKRYLR